MDSTHAIAVNLNLSFGKNVPSSDENVSRPKTLVKAVTSSFALG